MKESERETIKLRANFYNSLAIVFAAAGIVAPLYSILHQMTEGLDIQRLVGSIFIAFAAGASCWDSHRTAKRTLKELDRE